METVPLNEQPILQYFGSEECCALGSPPSSISRASCLEAACSHAEKLWQQFLPATVSSEKSSPRKKEGSEEPAHTEEGEAKGPDEKMVQQEAKEGETISFGRITEAVRNLISKPLPVDFIAEVREDEEPWFEDLVSAASAMFSRTTRIPVKRSLEDDIRKSAINKMIPPSVLFVPFALDVSESALHTALVELRQILGLPKPSHLPIGVLGSLTISLKQLASGIAQEGAMTWISFLLTFIRATASRANKLNLSLFPNGDPSWAWELLNILIAMFACEVPPADPRFDGWAILKQAAIATFSELEKVFHSLAISCLESVTAAVTILCVISQSVIVSEDMRVELALKMMKDTASSPEMRLNFIASTLAQCRRKLSVFVDGGSEQVASGTKRKLINACWDLVHTETLERFRSLSTWLDGNGTALLKRPSPLFYGCMEFVSAWYLAVLTKATRRSDHGMPLLSQRSVSQFRRVSSQVLATFKSANSLLSRAARHPELSPEQLQAFKSAVANGLWLSPAHFLGVPGMVSLALAIPSLPQASEFLPILSELLATTDSLLRALVRVDELSERERSWRREYQYRRDGSSSKVLYVAAHRPPPHRRCFLRS